VFSEAYPAQLYDLSADPNELNNLAEVPTHKAKLDELVGDVRKTWELSTLREDVIRDQKIPALMKFVRGNDMFPEVERVRYLPYSD